jgi:hypothetical protein
MKKDISPSVDKCNYATILESEFDTGERNGH